MKCVPLLALLAVTACLHPVAALVGVPDGGDGGQEDQVDAGLCTDDSQCPGSDYCDFTVTLCPYDGGPVFFGILNAGTCLPNINQASCHTGDECAEAAQCFTTPVFSAPGVECTREAPCDAGTCGVTTGPLQPSCPDGCTAAFPPHSRQYPCICTGNTCNVPEPDAGSGTCSYIMTTTSLDNLNLTSCEEVRLPVVFQDVGSGECDFNIGVGCGGDGFPLVGVLSTPSNDLSPPGGPLPNSLTLQLLFDCSTVDAGPFNCYFDVEANGVDTTVPFSGTCSCTDGG
jgi:hypothetical protein